MTASPEVIKATASIREAAQMVLLRATRGDLDEDARDVAEGVIAATGNDRVKATRAQLLRRVLTLQRELREARETIRQLRGRMTAIHPQATWARLNEPE